MFGFQSQLYVAKSGRNRWTVHLPLVYLAQDGDRYEVPVGFETDFASVPRVTQNLVDDDDYAECAVFHDYLYATRAIPTNAEGKERKPIVKASADYLFRESLQAQGCNIVLRWIMYLAVRWFGHCAWRMRRRVELQKQKEQAENESNTNRRK